MIQIAQCSKPGKQRVNTMRRPSGEYAGWRSLCPGTSETSRRWPVPLAFMIQMRPTKFDSLTRANRMRDPLGDQLGQRAAIPLGSWVSWASPVPSGFTV
jgi:hypothetical protein